MTSYLGTLVKSHTICYTYDEITLKSKPAARRGPRLRSKTCVWELRLARRSQRRKHFGGDGAKLSRRSSEAGSRDPDFRQRRNVGAGGRPPFFKKGKNHYPAPKPKVCKPHTK